MNTHKKKVSIILPFYNSMEFIDDCLQSVLTQTYTNIELMIINDGSNQENTTHIESKISDDRIVYLKNEISQGVASARNKGVKAATGSYVYFLDSDDLLATETIELLVEHIQDHPAILGTTQLLLRPSDLNQPEARPKATVTEASGRRLFKDASILNTLIIRDFFIKNNVKFNEKTKGYTDISGILALITANPKFPVVNLPTYYKRVRNDPITNPSLVQRNIEERTRDFITVYINMVKQFGESQVGKHYLDSLLLDFYRRNGSSLFEQTSHFEEFFELVASAVKMVEPGLLFSQPRHKKKEIQLLMIGNMKKFRKTSRFHREVREFVHAFRGFTSLKKYIYKKVFLTRPLKENYIIFESFLGKNYSDSPRNIYEYIIENKLDYKSIWVFNDKDRKIPGNAKVVKRFSLAYYYYFAVSKYWVNNMRQPLHLVKREGNVFLETWHGTPLKKLVFDMKDVYSANPKYKLDFYNQSRAWDYLLSPNGYSSNVFRSAFKFEKEMLEYGYPRNDLLYSPDKEQRAERVKQSIGIPKDKKVILYAPTWRDDDYYEPGKYKFQLKLDLKQMKERLGDEYVVALRMHYFIADNLNVEGLDDFAYNLSKYDDIAELYLISDILITDYSSVFFDYANLKRPILFYTYDLDKYRDQLRGFYIDFEKDAPGPLLRTSEEIIAAIINLEELKVNYSSNYEAFYEKFCSWHDGRSTERVVKHVFLGETQEPSSSVEKGV